MLHVRRGGKVRAGGQRPVGDLPRDVVVRSGCAWAVVVTRVAGVSPRRPAVGRGGEIVAARERPVSRRVPQVARRVPRVGIEWSRGVVRWLGVGVDWLGAGFGACRVVWRALMVARRAFRVVVRFPVVGWRRFAVGGAAAGVFPLALAVAAGSARVAAGGLRVAIALPSSISVLANACAIRAERDPWRARRSRQSPGFTSRNSRNDPFPEGRNARRGRKSQARANRTLTCDRRSRTFAREGRTRPQRCRRVEPRIRSLRGARAGTRRGSPPMPPRCARLVTGGASGLREVHRGRVEYRCSQVDCD